MCTEELSHQLGLQQVPPSNASACLCIFLLQSSAGAHSSCANVCQIKGRHVGIWPSIAISVSHSQMLVDALDWYVAALSRPFLPGKESPPSACHTSSTTGRRIAWATSPADETIEVGESVEVSISADTSTSADASNSADVSPQWSLQHDDVAVARVEMYGHQIQRHKTDSRTYWKDVAWAWGESDWQASYKYSR